MQRTIFWLVCNLTVIYLPILRHVLASGDEMYMARAPKYTQFEKEREREKGGRKSCVEWSEKSRTFWFSVNFVVFPSRRASPSPPPPHQQIFVISFPLLPEDKSKDKRHLFFIFCFLLSSVAGEPCGGSDKDTEKVWVSECEPIENPNQKLYGVTHALCEIALLSQCNRCAVHTLFSRCAAK